MASSSSRVTVLRASPHRLELLLDDVDLPTATALRHALLRDVPVLAPDSIEVVQYDGALPTETIAHRIGLLPIACNDGQPPHADATAVFELDVVWTSPAPGWVTSASLVCVSGAARVVHFRSDVEAAAASRDTGFPLFVLHQNQRAHFRAFCRVGTGREHARWNAVYAHVVEAAPSPEPRSFRVVVETTGAVTAQAAFRTALQAVHNRLRRIAEA